MQDKAMPEWIYENDLNNSVRYVLGRVGTNPLICIGINPSTAEPNNLDETLKSVERRANYNGYDSWIMLNVYPLRATYPSDLPRLFDETIHQRNLQYIRSLIAGKKITIWAAWGTLINKRPYLKQCATDLYQILNTSSSNWIMFGEPSKDGHPHHPLYVSNEEIPKPFPSEIYFNSL